MPDVDHPGDLLERLVDQQWSTAARHAWTQYQQRGRGAIVFSLRNPGSDEREPLRYLTFTGDAEDIAQSSMSMLNELVERYDPRNEVVIAAILPDERTVFDVYARDPAPVETEAIE